MFKKTCTVIVPAFFLILILCQQPLCHAQTRPASETVIARVNGIAISARDMYWETAQLNAEMGRRNQPIAKDQMDALRSQLIENLIEREILHQHAQIKKISIRTQWVEESLAELKKQLGGASAFQTYLSATGQTQSQLKERLKKGLTVQRLLRREAIRSLRVSEAEMQAYYRNNPEFFERGENIRVRHILVAVKNWNDEAQRAEARKKINALKLRIEKENDFAVLALEYSDCPSRIRAGDLGYLNRDQLVQTFADAAFALPKGAISDVISTRFGYHLIQMVDRTPPVPISYKEAREKIERTIRRDKENAAVRRYVAHLKSEAMIERLGSQ